MIDQQGRLFYIPWPWNTFWQLLLSRVRCCCRHCWTALSSARSLRQNRCASRLHACCSWGEPMCPWAQDDDVPISNATAASISWRIDLLPRSV